jgi:hypothetical protein
MIELLRGWPTNNNNLLTPQIQLYIYAMSYLPKASRKACFHWSKSLEVRGDNSRNSELAQNKALSKILRPVAYLAQMATEASLHSLKSVFNQRDPCLNLNFVKVNSRTNFQFSIIQFFRCSYATR